MRIIGFLFSIAIFFGGFEQAKAQKMEALSRRQQAIVPIASLTAQGDVNALKTALGEGLDEDLTVNEIKEVMTQLYAYAGFPRSLNALTVFMDVLAERRNAGITDAVGDEASPLPVGKTPLELGTATQTRLSGRPVQGGVMSFAPAIDYYLKAHLFGDIFGRDNLKETDREIATLAALASLEGTASQIRSHVRIATNVGLTAEQLRQINGVLKEKVGAREAWRLDQVLGELYQHKFFMAEPVEDVFPRGSVSAKNYFTGAVYNQRLVSPDSLTACQTSNVTFAAGSRTRWHKHSGTQLLLCTAGRGWYVEKGGQPIPLRAGDVVNVHPGVVHWHGAARDSEFSHISVVPNPEKNADVWLAPVSEDEYQSL